MGRNLRGIELEVIEVDDPTHELDGLDPKQRLFVVAHWAATAHPIQATITCEDKDIAAPIADPPAEELAEVVRWAVQTVLIEQATLVRRLVLVHTDTDVSTEEIVFLGEDLIESLE